jgi:hypothetical protein
MADGRGASALLGGNRLIVLALLIAGDAPVATQPMLETIEIQIDHRRGVERQQLAQCEPADQSSARQHVR